MGAFRVEHFVSLHRSYVVVAYSADEVKARKRIKACDAKPDEAVPLTHLTQLTQYSENPSRTCARMYAQHFSENNPSNVSIRQISNGLARTEADRKKKSE